MEQCYFISGIQIGSLLIGFLKYHSTGTESSVDFDFEKALKNRFLLGWSHSHPDGHKLPSEIDDATMFSWVTALGKPMLCGIMTKVEDKEYNGFYMYYKRPHIRYTYHIRSILIKKRVLIAWIP